MPINHGLRIVARVLSILAWLALTVCILVAMGNPRAIGIVIGNLGLGIVSFAILQGIAWGIARLSGNAKSDNGRLPFLRRTDSVPTAGPKGVGGWLLLFIIVLMLFSPLRNIASTAIELNEAEKQYPELLSIAKWSTYKITMWCIVLTSVALNLFAGQRLRKHHAPDSVTLAIKALWFSGPFCQILVALAGIFILEVSIPTYLDTGAMGPFLSSILGAILWTAYLKKSRRVRNTYFGQLY
ncbi:DUF2569 domain-containing protein [Bordetella avium]|uniref:Membrane protein n=1 Tax=Bordetella avium (strain 197N) TaxID=360910 RepID=Q2KYB8_BORA1|nr:DUF2569 domain-containing protein [Bordetella avium]AZY49657.1 DUF2569 domain-containing protein [Bordetella avium]AZY53010.1 DUF2569 domain-containing protein [Bordetella avium]RIQ12006.1 DUF2569 domain-containing protein [Bordetella avium]RIQ17687.1 DUF2569 domain-containing protein [Bordetella avium]RIQ32344.1 DUF2569 domain-containing protein [Bordetella avium]